MVRWSGIRTPTVRFFGCCIIFGTSRDALRMNVYGPGVAFFTARNTQLSISTNWPSFANSSTTSVKWCLSSSLRMRRIRSMPSALPSAQPSAKHESVGYAIRPPSRRIFVTCASARGCGLSG